MFQEFEVKTDPATGPVRLEALREAMREQNITAFLIPHADKHQNEYLPPNAERLSWLTGFTGSAGFCIVTMEKAVVFVDGRYTLQAKEQMDMDAFTIESLIDLPPTKWLETNAKESEVIAYDPWLITINQLKQYKDAVKNSSAKLLETQNLVDAIWDDRPADPQGKVTLHDVSFAGKEASEKIKEIQADVREKGANFCLLTDPASLAWLLNIRGTDMVHNPLALGFCILASEGKPHLFMDENKLEKGALSHLVDLHQSNNFLKEVSLLAKNAKFMCDPNLTASILGKTIEDAGGEIIKSRDPVILPRAIKSKTEIEGARAAHLRDGVAMAKFLSWLDAQSPETIDEISAAQKLEAFRADTAKAMGSELKEVSFDTISGFGPNGAIVHYRVNTDSNRKFENDNLYLCDSGGQYEDGTTDITRTIAIGTPPDDAITDFTLVLKGHIALALARFPKGTRGVDLDVLARNALWQASKDYGHGTGHGIGSYLNVHEGPQGIHKKAMEPLQAGMIVSNEPGFYVEGKYGIRIENLVLVTEAKETGGNIATHDFETLTLTPIDLRLVDKAMLNGNECDWLNRYHTRVCQELSPHLETEERKWLEAATTLI